MPQRWRAARLQRVCTLSRLRGRLESQTWRALPGPLTYSPSSSAMMGRRGKSASRRSARRWKARYSQSCLLRSLSPWSASGFSWELGQQGEGHAVAEDEVGLENVDVERAIAPGGLPLQSLLAPAAVEGPLQVLASEGVGWEARPCSRWRSRSAFCWRRRSAPGPAPRCGQSAVAAQGPAPACSAARAALGFQSLQQLPAGPHLRLARGAVPAQVLAHRGGKLPAAQPRQDARAVLYCP
jgi:hypothetical protein